jgi:hypothetical protein
MFQSLVKGILGVAFVLFCSSIYGQTSGVSNPLTDKLNNPYTKYGIGELSNGNTAELRGMGNITSAYADAFQINPDNPASYAFLQRTVIEGGLLGTGRNFSNPEYAYNTGSFSMDYLFIGFPVGKKGGLAFGVKPISKTYFSLVDTIFNSPIGEAERVYGGQGSLNYAFIGAARRFGNLSVGANLGYIFGSHQFSTSVVPIDTAAINTTGSYTSEYTYITSFGGLYWKLGALYEQRLPNKDYFLRIGATFALQQAIYEHFSPYQFSIKYLGDTTIADTIYNPGELQGKLTLPLSYSIGAVLSKGDVWSLGADYAATNWATFKSNPDSQMNVNIATQSYKLSVGGSYSPVFARMHKHLARASYRFGMYFGTDYLNIQNTPMPVYGLTFGCSFHFKPTHFAWVNMHGALDLGRTGTQQNNLIEQSYIKMTLGLSFNDKWFIPRKYD